MRSRLRPVSLLALCMLSAIASVLSSDSAWPEPSSDILSQLQEAEREFLAMGATGTVVNACAPINPCANGGICTPEIISGFYTCTCIYPYWGFNCENTVGVQNSILGNKKPKVMGVLAKTDDVASATVHATETDSIDVMAAVSSSSSSSSSHHSTAADDYCSRYSPCLHGGVCQSSEDGSYKCICKPGWVGRDCALALDTNSWGAH